MEANDAIAMDRLGNDRVAEAVAQHPGRLVGLGSLPLHEVALAAAELERCVRDLGLRGVIISSHVNGVELGDERLRPFWAKAEQTGAVIFIHPAGSTEQRMLRNRMMITIGQPLEEAYALSSLIYEGVMDEFPKLEDHGRAWRRLSAVLCRPARQRVSLRPRAAAQGRFQQLPAALLLRQCAVQSRHAGVPGDEGRPSSHVMARLRLPVRGKKAGRIHPRRQKIGKKEQDAILGTNAARLFSISI